MFADSESPISTSQKCFIVTTCYISHRFEAGANVCSMEQMVGPVNPPLLENGSADFDAVWRTQVEAPREAARKS